MYERDGVKFLPLTSAIIGGIVVAIVCFAGGYAYSSGGRAGFSVLSSNETPPGADLAPVWKAWKIIDEHFVPAAVSTTTVHATTTAEINEERVFGMISGLADSLGDPYTFFLPPTKNEAFVSEMSGSFEGVGMEIDVKDKILTVVSPLKGTPADRAGLRTGDEILEINGESTDGLTVSEAVQLIRGPKGSKVTFLLSRSEWSKPKEISVIRDVINIPVVETESRSDRIFVITVSSFTANAPLLFRNALREFVQSKDHKLILDLRGNPGGYLDAAVSMASWFLPRGAAVVTEDYAGHEPNVVHRSIGYDVFNDNLQMIILVNEGSASASEILAAALRDSGKATLVGEQTFGKGVVQELFQITPETSLKITVARWLTPDGKQIPHEGIKPDVEVKMSEEDIKAKKDPQMDKAVELLKARP